MAAQAPGPLATLAAKLRASAPPSISELAIWVRQGEDYLGFVLLVRQYLPERERAILGQVGVGERIATFANHFRDRYFPLPGWFEDGEMEEYGDLTACIPIVPRGIDWDTYHELTGWVSCYQVLAALCENPCDDGHYGDDARIALLESCSKWVPKDLLARTGSGYSRETLHACLDGTRFEAAARMADWLHCDTDNAFLDLDDETAQQVMEPWDPRTVRYLTQQWHQADLLQNQVDALGEWILKEPQTRFTQLLHALGVVDVPDPRQMRLPGPEFQPGGEDEEGQT